jgi:hypothetical protein
METTGKIVMLYDEKQVSEKFRVREFVIETEDKYPQRVIFQCINDRVDILDKYRKGDMINVKFNINGREHNGRYYNSLTAWAISKHDSNADIEVQKRNYTPKKASYQEDDDMPF